jgi:hypothetical protein
VQQQDDRPVRSPLVDIVDPQRPQVGIGNIKIMRDKIIVG